MKREEQIDAIVDFVSQHPESVASRAIRRQTIGGDASNAADDPRTLRDGLEAADEETLMGYYYLVK